MNTEAAIKGLAKRLVTCNLLPRDDVIEASAKSRRDNTPLVRYLVRNRILGSDVLARTAAEEFGLPLMDLAAFDFNAGDYDPTRLVSAELIRKHHVMPLVKRGSRLSLAVSDPSDVSAVNEIKFHTDASIDLVVVEDSKLDKAIDMLDENGASGFEGLDEVGLEDIDIEVIRDRDDIDETGSEGIDDTPIVRFVNKVLLDAVRQNASDIHLEPYEKSHRVRYRLDGVLKEIARPPASIATRICARIKVMAQLDISERRRPQDGRIRMRLSKTRTIDLRVNTLPTLWGEKIVLRILDPGNATLGIDALGFDEDQKRDYLNALNRHQGMVLMTGPTGSGKTMSLYAGLNILNTSERNISTAEDPVELNLEGINQVAINARVGMGFASALRAFLRQDPDVIMVGEIRDLETAEIAIKAAQTGHLVMSTLHTNSAAETLGRLLSMGIPAYNLATSVTLIIAQRLARRLCNHCKKPVRLPAKILLQEGFSESQLENPELFSAKGCDKCNGGYRGRIGIYEVVPITDGISRIIMDNGNAIQIEETARAEGFNDLRTAVLEKVARGMTSLAEANRIT